MNWTKRTSNIRVRLWRKNNFCTFCVFFFHQKQVTWQLSTLSFNSFSPSFDFSIRSYIFFLFLVGCFGAQSKSLFILLFVNRRYDNQKTVDHIEYFGCLSQILPSIPFIWWWWCAQKTNSTFATIWNYQYDVFPQFVLKKFPFVQWFGVLVFV